MHKRKYNSNFMSTIEQAYKKIRFEIDYLIIDARRWFYSNSRNPRVIQTKLKNQVLVSLRTCPKDQYFVRYGEYLTLEDSSPEQRSGTDREDYKRDMVSPDGNYDGDNCNQPQPAPTNRVTLKTLGFLRTVRRACQRKPVVDTQASFHKFKAGDIASIHSAEKVIGQPDGNTPVDAGPPKHYSSDTPDTELCEVFNESFKEFSDNVIEAIKRDNQDIFAVGLNTEKSQFYSARPVSVIALNLEEIDLGAKCGQG